MRIRARDEREWLLSPNLDCSFFWPYVVHKQRRPRRRRRRRRQRERRKGNRFRLAEQQLCTCVTLFCAFLCRRWTTTTWKCRFSRFLEEVNTKRRFYKSFEKIVELNSRKIHQIENLVKRHGIRDVNFKKARIHLSDVFSHVVVVVASHVWCHKQTLDKRNYSRSNYLSSEHFIDRAECLFMWWFSFREKYRVVLPLL